VQRAQSLASIHHFRAQDTLPANIPNAISGFTLISPSDCSLLITYFKFLSFPNCIQHHLRPVTHSSSLDHPPAVRRTYSTYAATARRYDRRAENSYGPPTTERHPHCSYPAAKRAQSRASPRGVIHGRNMPSLALAAGKGKPLSVIWMTHPPPLKEIIAILVEVTPPATRSGSSSSLRGPIRPAQAFPLSHIFTVRNYSIIVIRNG